jgi:hypothetical protein
MHDNVISFYYIISFKLLFMFKMLLLKLFEHWAVDLIGLVIVHDLEPSSANKKNSADDNDPQDIAMRMYTQQD